MDDHKLTSITLGCLLGILLSWQGLEALSDNGLTVKEWLAAVGFAIVCGAVMARVSYLILRRVWKDDDE
jgi:hypothetical protein